MSELVVLPDLTQVAQEAARRWVAIAREAAAERGSFSVALSGGSTPRALYTLLAAEPWRSQAPWDSTHVFWGDERRVPATDPQSNYRMARETLLEHVPIPAEQVYRVVPVPSVEADMTRGVYHIGARLGGGTTVEHHDVETGFSVFEVDRATEP